MSTSLPLRVGMVGTCFCNPFCIGSWDVSSEKAYVVVLMPGLISPTHVRDIWYVSLYLLL